MPDYYTSTRPAVELPDDFMANSPEAPIYHLLKPCAQPAIMHTPTPPFSSASSAVTITSTISPAQKKKQSSTPPPLHVLRKSGKGLKPGPLLRLVKGIRQYPLTFFCLYSLQITIFRPVDASTDG